MRIGELADRVGIPTDTVRFYEREGWLPRPPRQTNGYRAYDEADVEHLRLLIDLRRLELPLEEAARLASWCHSGHCADTTAALPALIAARRAEVAGRLKRLRDLDDRLANLERHISSNIHAARGGNLRLEVVALGAAAPCCDAATAVAGVGATSCACCAPAGPEQP